MDELAFVPHTNWQDKTSGAVIKTKEIPCLRGKGRPTTSTIGEVGCLYMDTDSGVVYKCTAASEGVYTWVDALDSAEMKRVIEAYLAANPPADGEDGGHYTPVVTQPTADTMKVEFSPCKAGMAAVEPVTVKLPVGTGSDSGQNVTDVVRYTTQSLTPEQRAQARANIGAQEEVGTIESETLKTVAIKYNPSANNGGGGWVDDATFGYTTEGTNNNYGPVVAEQSAVTGGLLRVNWDRNAARNFDLNLYLFDSSGTPYKWAGAVAGGTRNTWAGELVDLVYNDAGVSGSWGTADAPFSVQIPDGCTVMCAMRWVPGNASSPDGSIADATAFQNWVLSGGVTSVVEKSFSGYVEKNFGTENANRYLVTDENGKVIVGSIVGAEEGTDDIPNYITAEISDVANTLKAVQEAHPKSATFAFLTDHHFHYNSEHLVRHNLHAIEEISKKCRVEFAAYGGDNIAESTQPHDYGLKMLRCFGNILRDYNVRTVVVKGNHDDNTLASPSPASYLITDSEFYTHLHRDNENVFNICMDENRDKLYFYVDLPSQQIRVICLNVIDIPVMHDSGGELVYWGSRDNGFSNEQLNWVISDALDFSDKKHPEQWGVITIQHIPDCRDIPEFGDPMQEGSGAEAMYGIFRAFRHRTTFSSSIEGDFAHDVSCDFSDAKAELICRISGHSHADRHVIHDGILYVSTMAAGKNGVGTNVASDGNTYNKTEDSGEESAFDFLTFDKDTKTIYATRFGAGVDRVIRWAAAQTETLETVSICYDATLDNGGGAWVDNTTFQYTEGTGGNYGPVAAKRSTLAGGLLRVTWDNNVAKNFDLCLYLFDSDGNPYKWAGMVTGGSANNWAGELYEPVYNNAGDSGSWGHAQESFSVQIPDGCTVMCAMRWVPGNAGSPDGSIADATAFQNWVLSGGITFTVTK